jgi:hypothetical protein
LTTKNKRTTEEILFVNAHNHSFAIGWQTEKQSTTNPYSAAAISKTFLIEL